MNNLIALADDFAHESQEQMLWPNDHKVKKARDLLIAAIDNYQRVTVPLTDKQIMNIYEDCDEGGETLEFTLAFARAIEKHHGIGKKQ